MKIRKKLFSLLLVNCFYLFHGDILISAFQILQHHDHFFLSQHLEAREVTRSPDKLPS